MPLSLKIKRAVSYSRRETVKERSVYVLLYSMPILLSGGKRGDVTQAVEDAENRKVQLSKILLTNELDYPILSGR